MFYVHEVTGTIVQRDSKPGWFWKGGYETEFQARSVSYDISKNSRDPFRAIYLFAKFFIFIAFILIVLLVKCISLNCNSYYRNCWKYNYNIRLCNWRKLYI